MKIAWFTPFSQRSAIGRCSQGIVTALAELAQVDLCYFDSEKTYTVPAAMRRFGSHREIEDSWLSLYDIVFYNLGNHLPFHKEIYDLSRRWPGVCILHDSVLHHFFAAYFLEHLKMPHRYVDVMGSLYGEPGIAAAKQSLSGRRVWESDEVAQFPLFEEAIRGAEGVITHSEFFRARVDEAFPGPVKKIPLPYSVDLMSHLSTRADLGIPADHILIVTIGHVNPNKQIVSVIDALASVSDNLPEYSYAIIGSASPEYRKEVDAAIGRGGLQGRVRLLGEVSEKILRSYLSAADLCINLRYPAIEGASASVIEEMLFGKTVVVSDIGFYAELPNECVVKVKPQSPRALTEVLKRLLSTGGEEERRERGKAAQEYAGATFRADHYAKALLEFAGEVRAARPLLKLTDKVAAECNRIGVTPDMPLAGRLSSEIYDLFCGGTIRS